MNEEILVLELAEFPPDGSLPEHYNIAVSRDLDLLAELAAEEARNSGYKLGQFDRDSLLGYWTVPGSGDDGWTAQFTIKPYEILTRENR